jgi:hypothetical protein
MRNESAQVERKVSFELGLCERRERWKEYVGMGIVAERSRT